MPKKNKYLLFEVCTNKYCDGKGNFKEINESTNYSQEAYDSSKRNSYVVAGIWKFVRVEENGTLTEMS